jgi:hypothetical protein
MSALGHKRTFRGAIVMSALPPKADMCGAATDVRFGPIADIQERAVQTERPPRGGLAKIRSGAIRTPQLLVCLCATFELADARLLLEAALPDFGGLYLCLIRQPSKQNLAFNLYGRRELDLFSKPSSQDFHLSISLKKETRRS